MAIKKQERQRALDYLNKIQLTRESTILDTFETPAEQKQRIERAKKDLRFMVEYYFPHYATAPCAEFQIQFAKKVLKNKTYKGFCQWGRGLAKSVWNNIFIPFHQWLNDEAVYLVIVGNSADRARQLLDDLKSEFEANQRIIYDFGNQQQNGYWEEAMFRTADGKFIGQALGMGQSVRGLRGKGKRPSHIVADDIETRDLVHNPRRQDKIVEWIEKDLLPTMDGDVRRFIQANNKYSPRMIQTELQSRHPNWDIFEVKAYDSVTYEPAWSEKYPPDYYKELEQEIGILAAKAEYNNDPHIEGKIFKNEDIQWSKLPRIDHFKTIVGHWDIAYAGSSTSDFNAVRLWGLKDKQFYYIDSFVRRTKMFAALDWMAMIQQSLPQSTIIHWRYESQFWNDEVERTIREAEQRHQLEMKLVKVDTPRSKKYDRILSLQTYYQNGRIYFNEKKKAHKDTQEGIAQLLGIEPNYKGNDDAPDADQQAIQFLSKHIYSGKQTKPRVGKFKSKNKW